MGKNNLVNFYFIPFFLIFNAAFSNPLFSQSNIADNNRTNYEILSDLLVKSLSKIEDRIIIAGKDKTYLLSFKMTSNSDKSEETKLFFQGLILSKLRDYKVITDSSLNFDSKIQIGSPYVSVSYKELRTKGLIGDKLLKRSFRVKYIGSVGNESEIDSKSFSYDESYSDEISIDKIPLVEDNNFRFTRSSLPRETTFNKILIPAAIILSTAAAIILFFTIRK